MSVIDEYKPLNEMPEGDSDYEKNMIKHHAETHGYRSDDNGATYHHRDGHYIEPNHPNGIVHVIGTTSGRHDAGHTYTLKSHEELRDHLMDTHGPRFGESNDDDSAEDAEGKDGDNDGESSAEIGNSEDKGFDNKFNKRYKGRAFGHALRVHRSKEEESMSSVINRARQILGIESKHTEKESDSISEVKLPSVHGFKIGQVVKINPNHPSYDSFSNRTYGSSNYRHRKKLGLPTEFGASKAGRAQARVQLGVVVGKDDKDDHLQVAIHRHSYGGQNYSQRVHKDALSAVRESEFEVKESDEVEFEPGTPGHRIMAKGWKHVGSYNGTHHFIKGDQHFSYNHYNNHYTHTSKGRVHDRSSNVDTNNNPEKYVGNL
jgi:hypothetical protein